MRSRRLPPQKAAAQPDRALRAAACDEALPKAEHDLERQTRSREIPRWKDPGLPDLHDLPALRLPPESCSPPMPGWHRRWFPESERALLRAARSSWRAWGPPSARKWLRESLCAAASPDIPRRHGREHRTWVLPGPFLYCAMSM